MKSLILFLFVIFSSCVYYKTASKSDHARNRPEQITSNLRDTTITGDLQLSKAGHILITENNNLFYLNRAFNDSLINKRLTLFGKVTETNVSAEELGYDSKEYSQGAIGLQFQMQVDTFFVVIKK